MTTDFTGLDKSTTRVILASTGVLLLWSVISSVLALGAITASIITYGLYLFYWIYGAKTQNPLVIRLLIFGTLAGILELAADHYLVDTIDSLVYPANEPMIWSSPLYMPFAWSNILLQLGFVGILITRKWGIIKASIALGIAGGMYIPAYEHLAKDAGWWWYNSNTSMILNAPVYVIVCEALISLSLPAMLYYSSHHNLRRTAYAGLLEGVWIFLSAVIAFTIAH
jgi:hypothetical protein